jgi:tetratricopeptide (TPR) repeat protein
LTSLYKPFFLYFYLIFLAGCVEESKDDDAGLHVASARSYLDQGQFNASLIESATALQIDENNSEANLVRVEIYLELGFSRKAKEILEGMEDESIEYYLLLMESYKQRGKYGSILLILRQQAAKFQTHEVDFHLLGGEAWLGLQKLDNSGGEFEAALKIDPENVTAKLGLVRLNGMRGDLELAEQQLAVLLAEHPRNLDILLLSAAVFMNQGRVGVAEARLSEAVSLLPITDVITRQRANLLQVLIRLLVRQGRSGEALIYQETLANSYPNAQEFSAKIEDVKRELGSGKFKSALTLIEEIETFAPENETTGALRGFIAFAQGDDSRAEEFFLENVDVEVAPSSLLETFALNQFRMNQPHRVVQILRENAKNSQDPDILALFGVSAISSDFANEGVAALRKAIDLAPERVRLSVLLAQHINAVDPQAALELLEAAFAIRQDDSVLNQTLLNLYFILGLTKKAQIFAENAIDEGKGSYSSVLLGGHFYLKLGEHEKAADFFREAVKKQPEDMGGYLGLGAILNIVEKYDEAEAIYRSALAVNDSSFGAYQGILDTYVSRGEASAGVLALSALASETGSSTPLSIISAYYSVLNQSDQVELYLPKASALREGDRFNREINANIYYKRALSSLKRQDVEKARREVFTALSYYPANIALLALLVEIEIAAEAFVEANKVIEQIEFVHPDSRILLKSKGYLALAEGNAEAASPLLEAAWARQADDLLGEGIYQSYRNLEQNEKATQFLPVWLKLIPNSAIATIHLAEYLALKGEEAGAIKAYKALLAVAPDSAIILNNLAWLYFEADNVEQALTNAQKAFEITSNNGSIADTYGWILFKLERYEDAERVLTLAASLSSDPEIKQHLVELKGAIKK